MLNNDLDYITKTHNLLLVIQVVCCIIIFVTLYYIVIKKLTFILECNQFGSTGIQNWATLNRVRKQAWQKQICLYILLYLSKTWSQKWF